MKIKPLLVVLLFAPALCIAATSEVSGRQIDVPQCASTVAKVVYNEFKCTSADC